MNMLRAMRRLLGRRFSTLVMLAAIVTASSVLAAQRASPAAAQLRRYDLLVAGGTVIDGTGVSSSVITLTRTRMLWCGDSRW